MVILIYMGRWFDVIFVGWVVWIFVLSVVKLGGSVKWLSFVIGCSEGKLVGDLINVMFLVMVLRFLLFFYLLKLLVNMVEVGESCCKYCNIVVICSNWK